MIDTHFKSEQNQFLHLDTDTETILSAPLYILLGLHSRFIPFQNIKIQNFNVSYAETCSINRRKQSETILVP